VADVAVECQMGPYGGSVLVSQNTSDAIQMSFEPSLPDRDCCEITLTGSVEGVVEVRTLAGDVDGDGYVYVGGFSDSSVIKSHLGATVSPDNFVCDVDVNGTINAADLTAIKPLFGGTLVHCP
jgi:hypothetical protein